MPPTQTVFPRGMTNRGCLKRSRACSRRRASPCADSLGENIPRVVIARKNSVAWCSMFAMPELNGLDLQQRAQRTGRHSAANRVSHRHGDIPMSVQAYQGRRGGFPHQAGQRCRPLCAPCELPCSAPPNNASGRPETANLRERLASLTPREREVDGPCRRRPAHKQIAGDLGTGRAHHQVPSRPGHAKDGGRVAGRPGARRGKAGGGEVISNQ